MGAPVPSTSTEAVSRMSAALAPTSRRYSPPSISQRLVFTLKERKALSSRGMVTVRLSPGWRKTLEKPLSSRRGVKSWLLGRETYSWATSAPARLPVLVRVKVTFSLSAFRSE